MKRVAKITLLLLCCFLFLIVSTYYCVSYGNVIVSNDTKDCYAEAKELLIKAESAVKNSSYKELSLSSNNSITIENSGIYQISGTYEEVSININTQDDVILILNNTELSNSSGALINIEDVSALLIYTVEGTNNSITSGNETEIVALEEDLSGAAIYSKDDLYFAGQGTLTVNGYINNAVSSNDSLLFLSGTYNINAMNNGLKANDYLEIYDGIIDIVCGNDGIKTDNDDLTLGDINIYNGKITITTYGDGIQALANLNIEDGTISISSANFSTSSFSNKISSINDVTENMMVEGTPGKNVAETVEPQEVDSTQEQMQVPNEQGRTSSNQGGRTKPSNQNNRETVGGEMMANDNEPFSNKNDSFNMGNTNASNQSGEGSYKGIKAQGTITINGGIINISTNDDCIHSNSDININKGTCTLSTNDDGIHADNTLIINGGDILIENSYEGVEGHQIYVNDGTINICASDDGFNASGTNECILEFNGGNIYVDADGDGLDSNGDLIVNDGYIIVNGPTNSSNGPLDSGSENGGSLLVNGGELLAIGASGMDEGFENTSSQCSLHLKTSSTYETGSVITILDDENKELFSYTSVKSFSSVVYTSSALQNNTTYTVLVNNDTYALTMSDNVASNSSGSNFSNTRNNNGASGKKIH